MNVPLVSTYVTIMHNVLIALDLITVTVTTVIMVMARHVQVFSVTVTSLCQPH